MSQAKLCNIFLQKEIINVPDIWVYIITFLASVLTLLTGFGLGTILTAAFALIYDVKVAIFLVAIVHFLNNVFKFSLFRKSVDFTIIKRFGIISILGALLGSFLQVWVQSEVVKIMVGVVLMVLGAAEFVPENWSLRLPQKIDVIGGFFSGFLGGLVGNQGAIRSAYLLNYEISKETFIATATVIAMCIDATRIPVYITLNYQMIEQFQWTLAAVVAIAFFGTIIGKRLLSKVPQFLFKKIVAVFVILMGFLFTVHII